MMNRPCRLATILLAAAAMAAGCEGYMGKPPVTLTEYQWRSTDPAKSYLPLTTVLYNLRRFLDPGLRAPQRRASLQLALHLTDSAPGAGEYVASIVHGPSWPADMSRDVLVGCVMPRAVGAGNAAADIPPGEGSPRISAR